MLAQKIACGFQVCGIQQLKASSINQLLARKD
jgi:hypothetical protein